MAVNQKIFSLGMLMSSIQIYNLNNVVQEDQLESLRLATDYAKLTSGSSHKAPFQKLLFLMRDWHNTEDFDYGLEGGRRYLEKHMKPQRNQNNDLRSVRKEIYASFENINCYLLPFPGKPIIKNINYDGSWQLMEEDFKIELETVISWLLNPSHLPMKKINDRELKSYELKEYLAKYMSVMQSSNFEIKSLFQATVEIQMKTIIDDALESYTLEIRKFQDFTQENFTEYIENSHNFVKKFAIMKFQTTPKVGSKEHEKSFIVDLKTRIETKFEAWKNDIMKGYENFRKHEEDKRFKAIAKEEAFKKNIEEKENALVKTRSDLQKTENARI